MQIAFRFFIIAELSLSAALFSTRQAAADELSPGQLPICGPNRSSPAETLTLASPETGKEREIEVGGTLFSTARGEIATTMIRLSADVTATGKRAGADYVVTIPAGNLPSPAYGNGLFPVPQATFRFLKEKGDRRGLSKPDIYVYLDPADNAMFKVRLNFGLSKQDVSAPLAKFQLDKCFRPLTGGFQREILYTGGSKGTITLQYREYMNRIARPAFSQELSYDLSEGNEIGFKGARIRILKVSNTGLRYVILKPLDE